MVWRFIGMMNRRKDDDSESITNYASEDTSSPSEKIDNTETNLEKQIKTKVREEKN